MKYYVLYVEECSPKIKEFTSKKSMEGFLRGFISKYGGLDDGSDNWIDHIFNGKKLQITQEFQVK